MRDFRFAFRTLLRAPGFTTSALLALTLGIGTATTIFSVVDRVLFRPLPYYDPGRLVSVGAEVRSVGLLNGAVTADEMQAWRAASHALADLAGYQPVARFTVSLADEPVEVSGSRVTKNFMSLLGVSPSIGRAFGEADFEPGATLAVLLSDSTWHRLYQGDPSVVGRSAMFNDQPAVVAGVLPREFVFPTDSARRVPDIFVPFGQTNDASARLTMIGRLAGGATVDAARTEIDAIAASRRGDAGLSKAVIEGASVEPLERRLTTGQRSVTLLLVAAVAVLVLISCANVANLLIARGTDRAGEIAIRRTLGADARSVVRLLLVESAVLAIAGALAGALLAYLAVGIIHPFVPPDLEVLGRISVDLRALAFTILASGVCVLVFGLGPALSVARGDVMLGLNRSSSRTTSAGRRLRQAIVGVEVVLAVVLLIGGGLMVSTMARLLRVDIGYRSGPALTMRVQLPRSRIAPTQATRLRFVDETLTAARQVPGVAGAGASEGVPLGNTLYGGRYNVEGFSAEWMAQGMNRGGPCCTQTQSVSIGYFDATGISLLRGRKFLSEDAAGGEPVAIMSERLARKFPAGLDPIGHYLVAEGNASDRRRIVGIVRDVRDMTVEREPLQAIYLPLEQRGASALTLVMRTSVDPMSVAPVVRQALQREAGPVVITDVRTLDDVIAQSTGRHRLNAWFFGWFGVIALVIAAIGIGSVISYAVARRTREIGVRLALGATPSAVRLLLVRESLTPVLIGLIVGVATARGLSRFVASLLYEVTPRDAWTYATVSAALVVTALAAAYLPARRAARIDPMLAIRAE